MPEVYECENCQRRGPLNEHGACSHCGSTAVISAEKIPTGPPPIGQVSQEHLQFEAHLDGCERCRDHPFNLCREGEKLLRAAGASYGIGRRNGDRSTGTKGD